MNSILVSVEEMPATALAGAIAGFLRHHGLGTNQIEKDNNLLIYVSHRHHVVWLSMSHEKKVTVIEGRTERPLELQDLRTLVSRGSTLEDVLQVLWPIDPEERYRSAVGMVR